MDSIVAGYQAVRVQRVPRYAGSRSRAAAVYVERVYTREGFAKPQFQPTKTSKRELSRSSPEPQTLDPEAQPGAPNPG